MGFSWTLDMVRKGTRRHAQIRAVGKGSLSADRRNRIDALPAMVNRERRKIYAGAMPGIGRLAIPAMKFAS
jgi:hypothetical protein